ncbi:cathepsin K-like isoform X2 [Parasteatoda tepidariorum]|uniref:cathepsin K-like isoform X2 n=1 Tax=Parasteatoda tepidariorum TaxID=114398 RepID=UPI0039BD3876
MYNECINKTITCRNKFRCRLLFLNQFDSLNLKNMNGILVNCVVFLFILNIVDCSYKYEKLWKKYMKKFKKKYDSNEEEGFRRETWEQNMREITKHNKNYKKGLHHYRQSQNHMTDWTKEEFEEHTGCVSVDMLKYSKIKKIKIDCDKRCMKKIPKQIDWSQKGIITPVKDQGKCLSCWAFSTTGALEAHLAMKTGDLIGLSEQNLVDCSKKYGCRGGNPVPALEYVYKNKGINTEKDYPYTGKDGVCKNDKTKNKAPIKTFRQLEKGDEEALKITVATYGPVIASIYITQNFVNYRWGRKWGEKGYFRLIRNENNQCQIASYVIMPIMA